MAAIAEQLCVDRAAESTDDRFGIQLAASGNRKQQQAFAMRYYPVVLAYLMARWRGTPLSAHVEDACQDVFAECFRAGGALERVDLSRPGGLRPYLYGVARNIARRVEFGTQRRFDHKSDSELATVESHECSVSHEMDREWAIRLVRLASARQEEVARRVGPAAMRRVELLKLRFRDDLPIRKIAQLWEEDAALLHREYSKARKEFLAALRDVVAMRCAGLSRCDLDRKCKTLVDLFA